MLGGVDINTGGTLTNVAYLDQAQTFTAKQTIEFAGTQLQLGDSATDYATFAVAADGELVITTVDADAAQADITLSPDGQLNINAYTEIIDNTLYVHDTTVDTADSYIGIRNRHIKTLGATTNADDVFGIDNYIQFNQVGGTLRYFDGIVNESRLTAGTVTDIDNFYNFINVDGGTVVNEIFGGHIYVDVEAAATTNDTYGLNIHVDHANVPGGDVIMLNLEETAGIGYGIYQNGSADNVFGGETTIAPTNSRSVPEGS